MSRANALMAAIDARLALERYLFGNQPKELQIALTQLLTDLRHFADQSPGVSWYQADAYAAKQYEEDLRS